MKNKTGFVGGFRQGVSRIAGRRYIAHGNGAGGYELTTEEVLMINESGTVGEAFFAAVGDHRCVVGVDRCGWTRKYGNLRKQLA